MLRIFAFLILFASSAFAQVPMTGAGTGAPSGGGGGPFVGPGDINGAAVAWWGLRAFSTAYATSLGNIADIVDTATGLASCTIKAKSNGDADLTSTSCVGGTLSVTTFCTVTHATGCSVTKLYDQSGNSDDVTNGTLATMPLLSLSAVSSKPGILCDNVAGTFINSGSIANGTAQPYTASYAAKRTTSLGGFSAVFGFFIGVSVQVGFDQAANGVYLYAGNGPPAPLAATDNVFHAVQNIFTNSTTATISSDGTTSGTLNAGGSTSVSGFANICGATNAGSNPLKGVILEVGFWAGDKSANNSAMNSNQHTYWGF